MRKPSIPKASDILAAELRGQILDSRLEPGSRFLSEAELITEYGLSRTTVREALHILELEGIISIRRGPKGGVVVEDPHDDRLVSVLGVLLHARRVPLSELLEVRQILEPPAASLAAERASAEDIAALVEATDRMQSAEPGGKDYHTANTDFHARLGEASGNEPLKIFLVSTRSLYLLTTSGMRFNESQSAWAIRAHRKIIEAIKRKDSEAAWDLTAKHVRAFPAWLSRQDANVIPISLTGGSRGTVRLR